MSSALVSYVAGHRLTLCTSGVGAGLAFTSLYLLGRKNRAGWITQAMQTGSWLIVGPVTGQWAYVLTGLVFPVMCIRSYRQWSAEENGADSDARAELRG